MQSLINKVHYFKIPVSDVKQAADWYSTVLGFRQQFVDEEEGVARLEIEEGPFIILVKADSGSRCNIIVNNEPQQIVTFTSQRIDDLYAVMVSHQVKVTDKESDEWSRFFKFYDADGNMFLVHS
ncbi:VOC family protein [Paenibacillus thermotolerans]|uniref:VOC family protein n=1 Tax=Paenibacillus thermotolerans TaxID=3027807 RepID=UPI002367A821|nr:MULTISPECIES: VOC family protein [unclassified Paenibacillus]